MTLTLEPDCPTKHQRLADPTVFVLSAARRRVRLLLQLWHHEASLGYPVTMATAYSFVDFPCCHVGDWHHVHT
jgi:hypothetical protein